MSSFWNNDQRQGLCIKDISSRLKAKRDADTISNGREKIILASPKSMKNVFGIWLIFFVSQKLISTNHFTERTVYQCYIFFFTCMVIYEQNAWYIEHEQLICSGGKTSWSITDQHDTSMAFITTRKWFSIYEYDNSYLDNLYLLILFSYKMCLVRTNEMRIFWKGHLIHIYAKFQNNSNYNFRYLNSVDHMTCFSNNPCDMPSNAGIFFV